MRHWTKQTPFTDPGESAAMLATIGPEPECVIAAIQGFLIHGGAIEYYGLAPQEFSRETLSVESRLGAILTEDDRPLSIERLPQDRALGTCRDYAVLVCAAMREHRRPARVRCGFASYLGGGKWEDHWLCELWSRGRWRRIDAQLDPVLQDAFQTQFSPADVPQDAFLTGETAWRECRAGRLDPASLGHGDATGLWFVYVNLVRDRLALEDRITSIWDDWRTAASNPLHMSAEMLASADELANNDPIGASSIIPWWVRT
jgi:hypothetical protein